MPTVRMDEVGKLYRSRGSKMAAVLDVSLEIPQGDFVFIIGSRGAGKTTLLDIISGEVKPDRGVVYLDEWNLYRLNRRQRHYLRYSIGQVPQESALNRRDTVFQNVTGQKKRDFLKSGLMDAPRVQKALSLVGLSGCEELRPVDLNYSQCRKVELAKAILHSPDILLLDEITERLDEDSVWDVLRLLDEMNRQGTTIVMATTDSQVVNALRRRVVTLSDGKIAGDVRRGRYGDLPKGTAFRSMRTF